MTYVYIFTEVIIMGKLFSKIVRALGKELKTFTSVSKDIITNENIDIKVVLYEHGQICFYYKDKDVEEVEIVIVATPISFTRALQIRYIYYPGLNKIANLSIQDPEGSLPILLTT